MNVESMASKLADLLAKKEYTKFAYEIACLYGTGNQSLISAVLEKFHSEVGVR